MPSIYQGSTLPSAVVNYTAATVTGATNATPIQITTSAAHGFQTGDLVHVAGVTGNTAANSAFNAPWTVTVTGNNTFTLNGSIGNGAYVSGGTALDLSMLPAMTIPSDGDVFNAAAFNVALQKVADRTQLLSKILQPSTGSLVLIGQYVAGQTDDTWSSWSTGTAVNGSWGNIVNGNVPLLSTSNVRCNHNDVFEVSFTAGEMTSNNTIGISVASAFGCQTTNNGVAYPAPGAGMRFPAAYDGTVSVHGTRSVSANGSALTIASSIGGLLTLTGLSGMQPLIAPANGSALITIWGAASSGNNGTFPITTYAGNTSIKIADHAGSVVGDANNGSIKWRIDNQLFDWSVIQYGITGTPTYNFFGHRQMVINHYRPTAFFTPGGSPLCHGSTSSSAAESRR